MTEAQRIQDQITELRVQLAEIQRDCSHEPATCIWEHLGIHDEVLA